MKSKYSIISSIFAVALSISALAAVYFAGIKFLPVKGVWAYVVGGALSLAGVIVWYFIHNLLHEGMHALFAVAAGGKILEFSAAFLCFYERNGKIKFRLNLRSAYAGWTAFVCKKPENSHKTLYISLLGGLFGSVLTLAAIAVIYLVFQNYLTYYFALSGVAPVAYMMIINYLSMAPSTDGRLMLLTDKGVREYAVAAAVLETESLMYQGIPLPEIVTRTNSHFTGDDILTCYDVEKRLSLGDVEGAKKIAYILSENDNCGDNEVIDRLFIEKFFIACVLSDEESVNAMKGDFLDMEGEDPAYIRAHAAYRRFTGETEWVGALTKGFINSLENCPLKGYAETERILFERFIAKL